MISHHAARRLLDGLAGDPETIDKLAEYIRAQERGPKDWESLSDREHNIRAANRAVEAISRVATLNTDLAHANARIAALEAAQRDLSDVLEAVLGMIEAQ